jgi:hypothetical protein
MDSTKPLRECPFCAETVQMAAIYCKHCQKDISPAQVTEPFHEFERQAPDETASSSNTIPSKVGVQAAKVNRSRAKSYVVLLAFIVGIIAVIGFVLSSGNAGSSLGVPGGDSSQGDGVATQDGSTSTQVTSPDSSSVTVQSLRCYQNGVSATVYNPTTSDFNVSIVLGWYVEEGSPAWEGGKRGVFAQETLYGIAFKGETTTINLDPNSELNTLGSGTCKVMVFNKWTGGED